MCLTQQSWPLQMAKDELTKNGNWKNWRMPQVYRYKLGGNEGYFLNAAGGISFDSMAPNWIYVRIWLNTMRQTKYPLLLGTFSVMRTETLRRSGSRSYLHQQISDIWNLTDIKQNKQQQEHPKKWCNLQLMNSSYFFTGFKVITLCEHI